MQVSGTKCHCPGLGGLLSGREVSTIFKSIIHRIKTVAKMALFGAVTVICFWANPNIFAFSFIVGIACSARVKETIENIKLVLRNQKFPMLLIGVGAAFFSLPVTIATCCSLWAANLGATLLDQAKALVPVKEKKKGK